MISAIEVTSTRKHVPNETSATVQVCSYIIIHRCTVHMYMVSLPYMYSVCANKCFIQLNRSKWEFNEVVASMLKFYAEKVCVHTCTGLLVHCWTIKVGGGVRKTKAQWPSCDIYLRLRHF